MSKKENLLALIVFFLSFFAYFLTLCPTVFTGDSGELISAAYTLGVPHSPGYPLYCLIGKLFTFIPLKSIAWRINLMSAVFAGLSATVIYFIVFRLIHQINNHTAFVNKFLPSAAAGLIYAYSNTFWSQAVVAEVYTIWIFALSLTFLVLILWVEEKKDPLLYLFSFLYGVSVTCHQLSLFFAPGFIALIFLYQPGIFRSWKTVFLMFDFFILGLCLYLYIPIRAAGNPGLNWNKITDIKDFINYLLRRQYGNIKDNFSPTYVTRAFNFDLTRVKQLLGYYKLEFSPIYVLFVFGFIPLILKARKYLIVLSLLFIFSGFRIWMNVRLEPHNLYINRVYLLAGHIIAVILISLGMYYLLDFYERRKKRILYLFFAFFFALLPSVPLALNYPGNDQSGNYIAYDYGMNILKTLDENAVLLGHGDNALFTLAYLKLVERRRNDVTVYDDISGDVFKETPFDFSSMDNEGIDRVIESLLKNTQRPLYITFGHNIAVNTKHRKDLLGVLYKVLRKDDALTLQMKEATWTSYETRGIFDGYLDNKDYLMREIISVYHTALGAYFMFTDEDKGISLYQSAARLSGNSRFIQQCIAIKYSNLGLHEEAVSAAKKVVFLDVNDPEGYYNLGVTYARAQRYTEAISSWRAALKIDPDFKKALDYIQKAREILSSTATSGGIIP